jgi:hypothetical protein
MQACISVGFVLPVSRALASERDGKTLDALLATRLSSPQIVLGLMAAGLFRFANGVAATLPVVVLMVYLGGVDPRFALLAWVGLTSTALGVAALSVVASVESRTAARSARAAVGLLYAWFVLPALLLMLRAFLLPTAPAWLVKPVLWALDGSPLGPAGSYFGVFPRPWGLVAAVFRMAATQVAIAGALTAWAVWRLRPASRALYDVEGRVVMLRALRAANRSRPRRRPCGADPVLWYETSCHQVESRAGRVAGRLVRLTSAGMLVVGTWWFAAPAFVELAERGYGPSAEAYKMPAANPLARVIVERLLVRSSTAAESGQARLEFNLALRQFSAMVALGFLITTCSCGAESVARERRRDTWLGLLGTPLSGRDIVCGKVLGALWRGRDTMGTLLVLWAVGLASGAVHPLGFLGAVVWLGVSGPLHGALGVASALHSDRPKWPLNPAAWPLTLVSALGMTLLMTVVPMALASASLLTYEEVQAAARSGAFPPLDGTFLRPWVGARTVVLACLAGIAAMGVWTAVFARSLAISFDALVGRPCRPAGTKSLPSPSVQGSAS